MPYCKNCGARITKFEKDLCPICGQKHPLEGATSDTVEITTDLKIHDKNRQEKYKAHFRLDTFLLFLFVGFTGAGFFYLNFKKRGLIWLICNLVAIAGLTVLFIFLLSPKSWITYVAPFAAVYLVNIGVGVYYLCKTDIKDGNGEFIH